MIGDALVDLTVGRVAEYVWKRPELDSLRNRVETAFQSAEFRKLTREAFEKLRTQSHDVLPGLFDESFLTQPSIQGYLADYFATGNDRSLAELASAYEQQFQISTPRDIEAHLRQFLREMRDVLLKNDQYGPLILANRLDDLEHALGSIEGRLDKLQQTTARVSEDTRQIRQGMPVTPKEVFTEHWFADQVKVVVSNANDRYLPHLNIDLPVGRLFDALGRTDAFFANLTEYFKNLRTSAKAAFRWPHDIDGLNEQLAALERQCNDILGTLETCLDKREGHLPFQEIWTEVNQALSQVEAIVPRLDEHIESIKPEDSDNKDLIDTKQRAEVLRYNIRTLESRLHALEAFVRSDHALLANNPRLILVGDAGIGKTHLLCDVSSKRVQQGLPTILLFGEGLNPSEFWAQTIARLGLNTNFSIDEYLAALNTYAASRHTRCLIIVDALNESDDFTRWKNNLPGIATKVSQYANLGLAVSLRREYENLILEKASDNANDWVRSAHTGFGNLVIPAVHKYFLHYGIEMRVPPLSNEYSKPLFLKVLCDALSIREQKAVPTGLNGITRLFDFCLASVNKKLCLEDALDYSEHDNLVQSAVLELTKEMSNSGEIWLSVRDAMRIVNQFLPGKPNSKSLYTNLVREGVLATTIVNEQVRVRFVFDLFADHLIARQLLDSHLDADHPETTFAPSAEIGRLLRGDGKLAHRYGLRTAFAVQVPERTGLEIFEVVPDVLDQSHWIIDAVVNSIAWREWKTSDIPKALLEFIDSQIIPSQRSNDFLNQLVAVSCNPENPFNADFLHRTLLSWMLPDRDSIWSTFLYYNFDSSDGADSATARLHDWASLDGVPAIMDPASLRLMGKSLAWFLTSTSPYIRDTATRALIRVFTPHIPAFLEVLESFGAVDDPYVEERLYAVAYGCAMRSSKPIDVETMARHIFQNMFAEGDPPPQILLTDYARGVIELACTRNPQLEIALDKIRPPFRSKWIDDPPSAEELDQKYGRLPKQPTELERATWQIQFSVMDWDFGRYIVSSRLHDWSDIPLSENLPTSPSACKTQFEAALNDEQRSIWKEIDGFVPAVKTSWLEDLQVEEVTSDNDSTSNDVMFQLVQAADEKAIEREGLFLVSLTSDQRKLYDELQRCDEIWKELRSRGFDVNLAKRWIVQRVFELGWTPELHADFDTFMNSFSDRRQEYKPERIGKKYQWIALHELLARVADNFHIHPDRYNNGALTQYHGAWQSGCRNFDPSLLITHSMHDNSAPCWWFPVPYEHWNEHETLDDWVRDSGDVPDVSQIARLISVTNPLDGETWLSLDAMYDWDEPVPPTEDKYEEPRRQLWIRLKAFLVEKSDAPRFYDWAKEHVLETDRDPIETRVETELHEVFLGEHFWSPADRSTRAINYPDAWINARDFGFAGEIHNPVEQFGNEFPSPDGQTVLFNLPSAWIVANYPLHWAKIEGKHVDEQGRLIAMDPSVWEAGPSTLLVVKNHFDAFLRRHDLAVVWMVVGEKMILSSSSMGHGRLRIGGAFRLSDTGVVGEVTTAYDEGIGEEGRGSL